MVNGSLDLSVIIPTRNSEATIAATLQSVHMLRRWGAQVIVVDSESTDRTATIAQAFGVEIMTEPPGNMYAAVNSGIRSCRSEWVTYINSDDMLYATPVVAALQKNCNDADVIYGDIDFVDLDGKFLHSWRSATPSALPSLLPKLMPIPQAGTLFRRAAGDVCRWFDTNFRYAADFDLLSRLSSMGARFVGSGTPHAAFRIHSQQASQRHAKLMERECLAIRQRNGLRVSPSRAQAAFVAFRVANCGSYIVRILRRFAVCRRIKGATTFSVYE